MLPDSRRALAFLLAALLLCLAALMGGAGFASAATPPPTLSASVQVELQTTLDAQMAEYKVPGAIVGLWFPTKGNWVVSSGVGDTSTGAAPQTTTACASAASPRASPPPSSCSSSTRRGSRSPTS